MNQLHIQLCCCFVIQSLQLCHMKWLSYCDVIIFDVWHCSWNALKLYYYKIQWSYHRFNCFQLHFSFLIPGNLVFKVQFCFVVTFFKSIYDFTLDICFPEKKYPHFIFPNTPQCSGSCKLISKQGDIHTLSYYCIRSIYNSNSIITCVITISYGLVKTFTS